MKNKTILFAAFPLLLLAVLGCSYFGGLQESSNKAINSTVGEERIGVPECDEAFDEIARMLSQNENDDLLTQTGKRIAINKIRENLKQKIEQNKTDKAKLAKDCREYKTQIDKFKTEENSNKK
jgi:hypothetical protein